MRNEQLIKDGIPLLVVFVSYLTFRWADNTPGKREGLIDSDSIIHTSFEPKL